ncbi:Phage-related tail fiber protein [Caballeronia glathei]|uniref:Tail protein n=1 Tax=Caballeronia glathei TaxID=60547 RepID=A0A069PMJ9_9BURK|nr:phage tail protein [Caballeronia glathei]KDR41129.1 tail protein [Caballeronia glathei]CDY77954.1 Phage-related tail fiber protein [Caballeronia glathei]
MGSLITVTDAGRAALVAPGNDGTNAHKIVRIGLATAVFSTDRGLTTLPNELKRIATFGGENIAPDTVHVTMQDDTSDQYTLFGLGLYLENDVLLGVYSQATPIMEKSPAAMLLLSVDIQFATMDAAALTFGDATFLNPPATTEVPGVIELATQVEVNAGTDALRAVTPKTAAMRYAALTGADFTGPITAKNSSFGAGTKRGNIWSDATNAYFYSDGHAYLGSQAADGIAAIVAGNNVAARALPSGRVLVGPANDDGIGLLQVAGPITAQTPVAGDSSKRAATTEFVVTAIASASVGSIVLEPRTTARAGFLKCNGALLNRADYPALWAYAQASGAIVAEANWSAGWWGCFSTGNGATTFRIPELRGEFLRCWDDARGVDASRGIGFTQGSQNIWHAHGASAAAVGDHVHTAWTDSQGWHGHHGNTYAIGDHQHVLDQPVPIYVVDSDRGVGASSQFSIDTVPRYPYTSWSGAHGHGFDTDGAGTHGHNVGIGGAGTHTHGITVNGDGGGEARPRNIALLALIRAY